MKIVGILGLLLYVYIVKKVVFRIVLFFRMSVGAYRLILLLTLVGTFIILLKIYKHHHKKREKSMKEKLLNPNTSEEEKERIREYFNQKRLEEEDRERTARFKEEQKERVARLKEKRKENLMGSLEGAYYLGGHEKIALSQKVDIFLYPDRVTFYTSRDIEVLFTIYGEQIEKVRYETINENTKELILNITGASVPINEITQVLVINYISDYGIENEVTISTGGRQDRNLYGMINVIRNEGQRKKQYARNRIR